MFTDGEDLGSTGMMLLLTPFMAASSSYGKLQKKVSGTKNEGKSKIKSIHQYMNPTFFKLQIDNLTTQIEIGKFALPQTKLAEMYYRRGVYHFLSQMYAKAAQDFESSFNNHSHFLHAYMCGRTHQIIGNYDKGLLWFKEALKLYDSYEKQMKSEGLDTVLSNWYAKTRDQIFIGGTKLRDNVSNVMTILSKDLNNETKEKQKLNEDQIALFEKWKLNERNITRSDVYSCQAMCNMSLSVNDLNAAISDLDAALNNYKEKKHGELASVNMKAFYTHNLALSHLYLKNLGQAKQYIDLCVTLLNEKDSSSEVKNSHAMELTCRVKKLQWFIYQSSGQPVHVIEEIGNQANKIMTLLDKQVKVEECFYCRLLPSELFLSIFQFLPHSTLGKVMQCDRSLYKLCLNTPQIWRKIYVDISETKSSGYRLQGTLLSYVQSATFSFPEKQYFYSIEESLITKDNKIEYVELSNCSFDNDCFRILVSLFSYCTHIKFKCVSFYALGNSTSNYDRVQEIHFDDCDEKKEDLMGFFKPTFPKASITYSKP